MDFLGNCCFIISLVPAIYFGSFVLLTICRFFLYLIDLRNNAKEKKLRVLLGIIKSSTVASINLPQTQLVWRGKPTATPCRKYSSPAATPTRKKLHQSTLLNHSCNWMTAPTPADSVQRDISSWPPSASTWRRTMPWSML